MPNLNIINTICDGCIHEFSRYDDQGRQTLNRFGICPNRTANILTVLTFLFIKNGHDASEI